MTWWIWCLLGLLLMAAEVVTPGGFFLFFFGASALLVGLATAGGITVTLASQGVVFAVLSVVLLVLLRRPLARRLHVSRRIPVDSLVGEVGIVLEEMAHQAVGSVELRGSAWKARNAGTTALGARQRCRVERVDGLTLWVRAD